MKREEQRAQINEAFDKLNEAVDLIFEGLALCRRENAELRAELEKVKANAVNGAVDFTGEEK